MRSLIEATVDSLSPAPSELIAAARAAPAGLADHDRIAKDVAALQVLEQEPPPLELPLGPRLKIAAWNAERLKYGPASAALVAGCNPDILLLTEADVGMARSGNRHTVRDLASASHAGFVYGVEFVELGLGDTREALWHAGQTNEASFHGNAIVSSLTLDQPLLIPLDDGGSWFAGEGDPSQRRLGGRNAIAAKVPGWAKELWVISVHLENRATPEERAGQMKRILDVMETRAGGAAMVIGGDLNTSALPKVDGPIEPLPLNAGSPQDVLRLLAASEPLFDLMAAAGFDLTSCNRLESTQRTRPDGSPQPPFTRIDWFFTRGLRAGSGLTRPAIDAAGTAISDHDLIEIVIEPN